MNIWYLFIYLFISEKSKIPIIIKKYIFRTTVNGDVTNLTGEQNTLNYHHKQPSDEISHLMDEEKSNNEWCMCSYMCLLLQRCWLLIYLYPSLLKHMYILLLPLWEENLIKKRDKFRQITNPSLQTKATCEILASRILKYLL